MVSFLIYILCVSVRDRERQRRRETDRQRESVCVCVYVWERACVCVCVCVCTPFLFDLSVGRIVPLLFSCPKLLPHATSVGFFFFKFWGRTCSLKAIRAHAAAPLSPLPPPTPPPPPFLGCITYRMVILCPSQLPLDTSPVFLSSYTQGKMADSEAWERVSKIHPGSPAKLTY